MKLLWTILPPGRELEPFTKGRAHAHTHISTCGRKYLYRYYHLKEINKPPPPHQEWTFSYVQYTSRRLLVVVLVVLYPKVVKVYLTVIVLYLLVLHTSTSTELPLIPGVYHMNITAGGDCFFFFKVLSLSFFLLLSLSVSQTHQPVYWSTCPIALYAISR